MCERKEKVRATYIPLPPLQAGGRTNDGMSGEERCCLVGQVVEIKHIRESKDRPDPLVATGNDPVQRSVGVVNSHQVGDVVQCVVDSLPS